MATNTNTAATIEVAASKRKVDVEYIYEANDTFNGIIVDLTQRMKLYGYPAGAIDELSAAFSNVTTELARAASFIVNPTAPDIVDGVKERIRCGID